MIPKNVKKMLGKQHYALAGKHSAVQICRWTKKSLLDKGFCYKEKFYGIKSSKCCQMSPCVMWCQNKCLHCWRAIELTLGKKLGEVDEPEEIIRKCILAQRKLLSGFKGNKQVNKKKWEEAQNPNQFAISLSGEPTIYPKIGKLIEELRKQKITSFLVTNGLLPEKLLELSKKKQLPTQLYISLNAGNEKLFREITRNYDKEAWKKFNKSLEIMRKLETRKVIRITLVKELNITEPENYAKLILQAFPEFIEIKSYMAIGFSRARLGYNRMLSFEEVLEFANKIAKLTNYKIEDYSRVSRVALLKRDKFVKRFIS